MNKGRNTMKAKHEVHEVDVEFQVVFGSEKICTVQKYKDRRIERQKIIAEFVARALDVAAEKIIDFENVYIGLPE